MFVGMVFHSFVRETWKVLPPSDSLLYLGQTRLTWSVWLFLNVSQHSLQEYHQYSQELGHKFSYID